MNEFIEKNTKLLGFVGVLLGLFLLASTAVKLKEYKYVGSGLNATNTITVSGSGKVDRSPDTAKISFSVTNESKEVKTAQDVVSKKVDTITKDLKALGIEEKYIKTDSYNSYPQYDYGTKCYNCPIQNPTIRGYEVSHSITVNVKDLDKVADVLGVLGKDGASNVSGPNFGFEDDKAIAREARAMAIEDAKGEAEKLAKSLGVRLVRIVSFSENGRGYPVMYAKAEMSMDSAGSAAPSLPIGETTVDSSVTLVYEIQ
jgi:uncharacterized protein YggE